MEGVQCGAAANSRLYRDTHHEVPHKDKNRSVRTACRLAAPHSTNKEEAMDVNDLQVYFTNQFPNLLQALLILIVGILIAFVLRSVVNALLERLDLDNRLNRQVEPNKIDLSNFIASIVFWVTILFTVVAVLNQLQLTAIAGPFDAILVQTTGFLPRLLGAVLLAIVAWIVATIGRRLVEGVVRTTDLDNRLRRNNATSSTSNVSVANSLGTLVYWLIWLLFLPGILDALGLNGLLTPVQGLVTDVVAFLPNMLSAALIFIVGYFVARIVRDIVTNLLASTGLDGLASRVGFRSDPTTPTTFDSAMRPTSFPDSPTTPMGGAASTPSVPTLSRLIGTVVFALILIPVTITALDTLQLDALSQPAIAMLNQVLDAIPRIFAAAILLAIAYFVARLIADVVRNILEGLGFNSVLARVGLSNDLPGGTNPSAVVATLITVGIMLFAAAEAANLLGFQQVAALISEFLIFFGNVVLGLIVLGLGMYLANLADRTIRNSDMQNSGVLATAARYAIILLTLAMALRQMGIAEDIVTLAFGLLLGAIAVAVALAFGLGGRQIAERELRRAVDDIRNRPDDVDQPPANPTVPPVPPTQVP